MPYPTPIPLPSSTPYPLSQLPVSQAYPQPGFLASWWIFLLLALPVLAGIGLGYWLRRRRTSRQATDLSAEPIEMPVEPPAPQSSDGALSLGEQTNLAEAIPVPAAAQAVAETAPEIAPAHGVVAPRRFSLFRLPKWVDALLLVLAAYLFCQGILDLGKDTMLPGNEAEVFQLPDWVLVHSLKEDHRFPLWNPYLHTGFSFVADPMLHAYNPVVTLPVLAFGVRDGYKIAIFLSYVIAVLGMWQLGKVMGMGRAVRGWVALMYIFAGQPMARFFQGQYMLIFGFAWIPWVIWGLFQLRQASSPGQRRLYLALTSLALALLFFSGNAYYTFLMAFAVALFVLISSIKIVRQKPYFSFDLNQIKQFAILGVVTIGLVAVQLIPLFEFEPHMARSLDVVGAQSPRQVLLDYISKDISRPDAMEKLPAREEFYAYIGFAPILALLALPLAFWKRDRKAIFFLTTLVVGVVLWVSIEYMPWRNLFLSIRFLYQFRQLLRILILGSFALILLAGLGLDTLWKLFQQWLEQSHLAGGKKGLSYLLSVGLAILLVFMAASVLDLYTTHQPYLRTQPADPVFYQVASWLRQYDPADYYTRNNPANTWHDALVSARLRFIDAWYHFVMIRDLSLGQYPRLVEARPKYVIQHVAEPPPDKGILVTQIGDRSVFSMPDSLPFVFSVREELLSQQAQSGELIRSEVVQQSWFSAGPNTVEVIATPAEQGRELLVVLFTSYPGWTVTVDGRAHPLRAVSGYLAVDLLPGVHKYVFSFRPTTFFVGLAISLLSLGLILYMIASVVRLDWRLAWARLLAIPGKLRSFKDSWQVGVFRGRLVAEAVYRQGVFLPNIPPAFNEGQRVRLSLETSAEMLHPVRAAAQRWFWASMDLFLALSRSLSLPNVLFAGALSVYLLTRLIGLTQFPIYFFADEAVQTLYAESLITNKFQDPVNHLPLPIYVEAAGNRWTPLISMYVHAFSLTLFGKSVFVTRATSAVVSLLAAISVGMILKQIFKLRLWWAGALLVAISPGWFLHSRTAFETAMTTAFFGMFLWFYLLYRQQSPQYLYTALVFGAVTFYTYSNAQVFMAALALLLLVVDLPYHWAQRRFVLKALPLVLLLALPLLAFNLKQPAAMGTHLRAVDSFWFHNIPLTQKLATFLQKYLYSLSPTYWFIPNTVDLPRHRLLGIAQLPTVMLPLFLIGFGVCLWKLRSPRSRIVLLAGLASTLGATLADVGITRMLAFTIPANVLIAVGGEWLLEKSLARLKRTVPQGLVSVAVFAALAAMGFGLLRTALVKGPLWFNDYGLYGMQYGAAQLFEQAIPEWWRQDAKARFMVSSVWANGADRFIQFFFTPQEQSRVQMISIEGYLTRKQPIGADDIVVLTLTEYEKAATSPKFKPPVVEKIIPYPNGAPGFYFVRLAYVDNVDEVFAAEKAERSVLKEQQVVVDGKQFTIRTSWLDMGPPENIFDKDHFTLMRGMEANPFIIELVFPEPRTLNAVELDLGTLDATLTAYVYPPGAEQPLVFTQTNRDVADGQIQRFDFGNLEVSWLRLEILSLEAGEIANVHVRELQLLP